MQAPSEVEKVNFVLGFIPRRVMLAPVGQATDSRSGRGRDEITHVIKIESGEIFLPFSRPTYNILHITYTLLNTFQATALFQAKPDKTGAGDLIKLNFSTLMNIDPA